MPCAWACRNESDAGENVGEAGAVVTLVGAQVGDMVVAPHTPVRPAWHCNGCGDAWPCATAKESMLIEYADCELALMEYLAMQCVAAIDDLRDSRSPVPKDLFGRFLGWAKL
ncbi:hypothetical protein Q0Z83_042660 [Actinoplanes sichuanensis]|nr:hypothetical protein Q0Z83_042660 [Actinoplanes sichuanensis]